MSATLTCRARRRKAWVRYRRAQARTDLPAGLARPGSSTMIRARTSRSTWT